MAPPPPSGDRESVSVTIDGDRDWVLTRTSYSQSGVDSNGAFRVSLTLSGDRVLRHQTAVSGGYRFAYKSVTAGWHTFTLVLSTAGVDHSSITVTDGPTLRLDVPLAPGRPDLVRHAESQTTFGDR